MKILQETHKKTFLITFSKQINVRSVFSHLSGLISVSLMVNGIKEKPKLHNHTIITLEEKTPVDMPVVTGNFKARP